MIMKNVTMNINPNSITYAGPPPFPSQSAIPIPHEPVKQIITVAFSAQFDNELKAQDFAIIMLNAIKHYGD